MTLLNVKETASRLRTTVSNVRRLIATDKDFPCYAYNSRSIRIIAEKLDAWILLQTQKTAPIVESSEKTETKPVSKKTKTASVKRTKA